MKRVLFARRTYGFGGVEVILLDWLKRIDYSEYEVFVCSPADVFSKRIADAGLRANFVHLSEREVTHIYGRYRPEEGIIDLVKGSFWHFFPIWLRFLWSIKPDAVVFLDGDFFTTPLACVLAAFAVTKGNVSMTIHSPSKLQEPLKKTTKFRFGLPDFGLWWYPRIWWPLWPWRMRGRLARRILAASTEIRNKVVRFYSYPITKMGLVEHGVDTARFKPCPSARLPLRQKYGIPEDAFVIASTSRLSPEKNVDRVVNAFDAVASKNQNLWLLLAGDGPLQDSIKTLVNERAAKGRILMLGHVEDPSPVLQAADAYVLASTFEARSISMREAMAVGLVCLGTRATGIGEFIEDGRDGFLMDSSVEGVEAGLERALTLKPSEREQMGRSAREKMIRDHELDKAVRSAFQQLGIDSAMRCDPF